MSRPRLKAVVAMASNRIIGKDGGLPWRLSEDLKWFKKMTLGHPIIMGRKTMESIGRPLPKRRNLVVSRSLAEVPPGFEVVASCEKAVSLLEGEEEASVIGGAQIYREMIPWCDEVLLSYVFFPYEGDTYLFEFEPEFDLTGVIHRDDEFELRRYQRRNAG